MLRRFIRLPAEICAHFPAGLLIPDIPLEETEQARKIAASYGIELVLLSTPTTSESRMAKIADATSGFVYLVRSWPGLFDRLRRELTHALTHSCTP